MDHKFDDDARRHLTRLGGLAPSRCGALVLLALAAWLVLDPTRVWAEAHASTTSPLSDPAPTVAGTIVKLEVTGLTRTHEHVVRQELALASLEVGATFDAAALAEGVQRLRNLLIFRTVDATPTLTPGGVAIDVRLTERWTVIPILRFASGGGAAYVIAGIYDVNLLGRYLEVGAQYENLQGTSSGVAWIRKPRVLGTRWSVGIDAWKVTRPRQIYDTDGALRGGFTLQRRKLNSFAERELRPRLRTGIGLELNDDRFDERGLSDEAIALNAAADGPALPIAARAVLGRSWLKLGRLDYDIYLVRGLQLTLTGELAAAAWGSQATFGRAMLEALGAWRVGGTQNLAVRVLASASNVDKIASAQHLTYIGGLDAVRGFADGELAGRRAWFANAEYRVSSFASSWLVVQHDLFLDGGGTEDRLLVASAGAGFRLLSPKIFRLTLRFDYAYTLAPRGNHGVAFGVQQFF